MTSKERHKRRGDRRRIVREARRKERLADALKFETVFTFAHMYQSAARCMKGVGWKASVQAYKARCGINVARKLRELRNGVCKLRKCPEFEIRERGHIRRINSICMEDRVPQKCNSTYTLKPVLHQMLTYDNWASQEGKGTSKARKRVKCMLERHIRRHGMGGGVITYDFRHYFDSIDHRRVRQVMERHYEDRWIIGLNMKIVNHCRKYVGLVLGSENSQDFAISVPSYLDHYLKEVLGVEACGRFMDDGLIIHPDFEYLKKVLRRLEAVTSQLGLELNRKKTHLIRFGKPFTFLQRKYSFTRSREIIIRPSGSSVIRERRKIKRLARKYLAGEIPYSTCSDSLQAWKASIAGTRCRKVTGSISRLFDQLLITPWLAGKEDHVLQNRIRRANRGCM